MWKLALLLAVAGVVRAQSPHDAVPDLAIGRKIFDSQCAVCHGQGGTGGRGPALTRPKLMKTPDEAAIRKAVREGLPPEMPGAWQLSVREIASVAAYAKSLGAVEPERLPGDPARGKALYAAQGCASCHIAAGKGTGVGPELTSVGARRNGAHLRESVAKPSAHMPDGFLVVEATTAQGRTVRGTRANEDSFTIQIRDAGGRFHSFRKSALRKLDRRPGESSMPAFTLPAPELDDLVAYLASLKGDQ